MECLKATEKCYKEFKNTESLKSHENHAHSVLYALNCDLCATEFKSLRCLIDHMKFIHEKDGVTCDICGKFLRKNCLPSHKVNVHKMSKFPK